MKYRVGYTHLVEKHIEAIVEANSEEEALAKAEEGDIIEEEEGREDGLECKDFKVLGEED